jgi:hypothetical protein
MVQQGHRRLIGFAAVDLDRDVIARHPAGPFQPVDTRHLTATSYFGTEPIGAARAHDAYPDSTSGGLTINVCHMSDRRTSHS